LLLVMAPPLLHWFGTFEMPLLLVLQVLCLLPIIILFFLMVTALTETYTLSLHDALPISTRRRSALRGRRGCGRIRRIRRRHNRPLDRIRCPRRDRSLLGSARAPVALAA